MCILDHMLSTFFYRGKFLKKLASDQCSSTTKGSINYIYIQHFTNGSGLTKNFMINGSIYYV